MDVESVNLAAPERGGGAAAPQCCAARRALPGAAQLMGCARTREDEANEREHGLPAVHELSLAHVVQVTAQLNDGGGDAQRVKADIADHGAVERRRPLQERDGR